MIEKKKFILLEAVLAVMVLMLACGMILEKNKKEPEKISVILKNPDDHRWAALRYGLEKAAEDWKMEMVVVGMDGASTEKEVRAVIEAELDKGADAVILQPLPGKDMGKMLRRVRKKIPFMLIEDNIPGQSDFPVTEPDHFGLGETVAGEILKDHSGKVAGKSIGILAESEDSYAAERRKQGVLEALKGTGAEVKWEAFVSQSENPLENQSKVDFIVALDDASLIEAGESSAANNLHGALVYGIGTSATAVYYLDSGFSECLVVPDEFNIGYQSMTQIARDVKNYFYKMHDHTVSHKILRRDNLFSEENQEILFTISQ